MTNTVERSRRVEVQRCEARTKPQWYRRNGGRCPYAAVTELDGQHLCQMHADLWVRGEGTAAQETTE